MPRKPRVPSPIAREPMQRMMHVHRLCLAEKFPNATTVGKELGISYKTVTRDITFMRDSLGLPMKYDDFKWGWYYTKPVSAFPTIKMSEGELFALLVAEKAVEQYKGTTFEKPLTKAFEKIAASLPDSIDFSFAEWEKSISFYTSAEPVTDLALFRTLASVTSRRQQISFAYRKPGAKNVEQRVVDPYQLANVNGEWYLFGYDHMRRDIRTFAPGRMRDVVKTGRTFKQHDFSVRDRLRDSFGVHSSSGKFEVVLQFNDAVADYIREKKWHASQQLREMKNGGVELTIELSSLVEIKRWIMSWGANVKVVSPRELAEAVTKSAEEIRQVYADPDEEKTKLPRKREVK